MKYRIQLIDQMQPKVLYEGAASVQIRHKDGLRMEFASDTCQYRFDLHSKGCSIQSRSELETRLVLRPGRTTKAHITSDYGQLEMDCCCQSYQMKADAVEIRYHLLSGDFEQTFDFKIRIIEQGEENGKNR